VDEVMSVKDFLYTPRRIYSQIVVQREKINALRLGMLPSAIRYDKDPVQTSPTDPMPEYVAKLDEAERELSSLMERYHRAIGEVCEMICHVPDRRAQIVLVKRYLSGKSWSLIEDECQTSRRTVFRQNRMGVRLIADFLVKNKSHFCH